MRAGVGLPARVQEGLHMEKKGKGGFRASFQRFWQGLCALVGALLLVDLLVCLAGALVSLDWLLNQAQIIVFTGVLLLVGIILYLPARRIGVTKVPRRLLAGGLAGGGLVLVFFVAMYIAAVFSMLEYIRHIKVDDIG